MSVFTTDPLETLQEWNNILIGSCCPCGMPDLGPPIYGRKLATCGSVPSGFLETTPDTKLYTSKVYAQSSSWTLNAETVDYDEGNPSPFCGRPIYYNESFSGSSSINESYDQNYSLSCSCGSPDDATYTEEKLGSATSSLTGYNNWCLQCDVGGEIVKTHGTDIDYQYDSTITKVGADFQRHSVTTESSTPHCCEPIAPGDCLPSSSTTENTVTVPFNSLIVMPPEGSTGPGYSSSTTYSGSIEVLAWIEQNINRSAGAADSLAEICYSYNELAPPPDGSETRISFWLDGEGNPAFTLYGPQITSDSVMYRWFVPVTVGNADEFDLGYCKITFDLVFFPDDPDAETVFVDTDITLEVNAFGAPVTEEVYDHGTLTGWWIGDWTKIPVPRGIGQTRIVNVRYLYIPNTAPFGSLPTPTGEAVEPDPAELNFALEHRSYLKPPL